MSCPKGVFDIVPTKRDSETGWRDSSLWEYVEGIAREIAKLYAYREMRTPMFERTELFARTVGESSDIVSKEMYTFEDRAGRSLSLRPEGTAPAVRALLDNSLVQERPIQKLFYLGPMFRYERQQKGRYRQHHQLGAEIFGSNAPELDAELIEMLFAFYRKLGIKHLTLQINSLGDHECRDQFRDALVDYLRPKLKELSGDSKTRFELNPLRILDSKDAGDQEILKSAPNILEFLKPECRAHFEAVQKQLTVPFEINHQLVRGLDYYNRTVFEVMAGELGAQNSIGAGGRYDGLVKQLGGPDTPALGYGTGLERIIMTMLAQGVDLPTQPAPHVLFIPIGDAAKAKCVQKVKEMRDEGISSEVDLSGKKLKSALKLANQMGVKYTIIVGEEELEQGKWQVKEMETHTGRIVGDAELLEELHV